MEGFIFPILLVGIAVMLFFQIRKQKRGAQEQQKLQNSLTEGDRVMTTSGLFGDIVGTTDDAVELEIAPGVTTTWLRQAIREKVNTEDAATDSESSDEDVASDEGAGTAKADATDSSEESETKVAEPIEKQKTS